VPAKHELFDFPIVSRPLGMIPGRKRFTATAEFLEGDEYLDHWNRLVADYPIYQTARDLLERPVPLVLLQSVVG